jgi:hypothetical protein
MKKIISCLLTTLFTSSLVACQGTDTLNRMEFPELSDNIIHSNSVLSPLDINEVRDGKATLKNIDSGVLISTFSGGKLDDKNDVQKLSLTFAAGQTNTNGGRKNINIARSTDPELLVDRHGQTEMDYLNEISLVNDAYRSGREIANKSAFINNVLKEGAMRTFKLENEDTKKIEERPVILKKATNSAYFWVAKNEINDIDETVFQNSVNYWESTAYPLVTKKFGAAPLPPNDVDGEAKINIYIDTISKNKGLFGYFSPVDVVGSNKQPQSNKTDMLYLNSWMFKNGEASEHYAKSTLIHEFQHLVNFNVKVTQRLIHKKQPILEDRWLNEGMSTYAEQLGGLGLPVGDMFAVTYLNSFFNDPGKFPVVTNDAGLNYGAVYLFVLYLVEQYGDSTLAKLTQSDKSGIANVELVTKAPFKKTFTDWATAVLLSGSSKNAKYDFKSIDLHKTYGKVTLDGINLKNTINQFPNQANVEANNWSVNYIKLDNIANQNLNLSLKNTGGAVLTANLVKLK